MAQNGAAAVRLLPDPPSHPSIPARDGIKHQAPSPNAVVVRQISEATAACVEMVGQGILDYERLGVLDPSTREATGNAFVRLYELSQATVGELDFHLLARTQTKNLLLERHRGADLDEGVVDDLLTHVLDILKKVSADERARAN